MQPTTLTPGQSVMAAGRLADHTQPPPRSRARLASQTLRCAQPGTITRALHRLIRPTYRHSIIDVLTGAKTTRLCCLTFHKIDDRGTMVVLPPMNIYTSTTRATGKDSQCTTDERLHASSHHQRCVVLITCCRTPQPHATTYLGYHQIFLS